jgi:hypothetical protein
MSVPPNKTNTSKTFVPLASSALIKFKSVPPNMEVSLPPLNCLEVTTLSAPPKRAISSTVSNSESVLFFSLAVWSSLLLLKIREIPMMMNLSSKRLLTKRRCQFP